MQSSFAVHATWIVDCNSYLFKRCFWWWKIDLANFSRLSILFYVNVKRCVVNKNVLFPLVSDTWIYRLQLLYFVMQVEMNSCMIIYLYMDVISDTFIYLNMWGYYSYYRIVCYSDILLVPRAKKLRFYWHIQMKNFATAFFAPSLSIFFLSKISAVLRFCMSSDIQKLVTYKHKIWLWGHTKSWGVGHSKTLQHQKVELEKFLALVAKKALTKFLYMTKNIISLYWELCSVYNKHV